MDEVTTPPQAAAPSAFLRIDERRGRGRPSSYAYTLLEVLPDGLVGREFRLRADGMPASGWLDYGTYNDSRLPEHAPGTPEFDAFWIDQILAERITSEEFEASYSLADQMFPSKARPVPDPRWLLLPSWLRLVLAALIVTAMLAAFVIVFGSLLLLGYAAVAVLVVPYFLARALRRGASWLGSRRR